MVKFHFKYENFAEIAGGGLGVSLGHCRTPEWSRPLSLILKSEVLLGIYIAANSCSPINQKKKPQILSTIDRSPEKLANRLTLEMGALRSSVERILHEEGL